MIKELQEALEELFEWLGDMNAPEQSHLLVPVEIEQDTRHDPLHSDRL